MATQGSEPPEGASRTGSKTGDGFVERLLSFLIPRPSISRREDLEEALSAAENAGPDISPRERAMLRNVLRLGEVRIADVMVPRVDIVAVPAATTLGGLLAAFREAGHSRLPVYGETLDDLHGMVHIRDVVDHITAQASRGAGGDAQPLGLDLSAVDLSVDILAARITRPVLYAPPSTPAIDLLLKMQASRTHLALVIDEYGGTDGLVSIEDLVEIVVGDIDDEHDETAEEPIQPAEGGFLLDARAPLDEVCAALAIDLSGEEGAEESDTIGGFLALRMGRLPAKGDRLSGIAGHDFEIVDADRRRIKRIMARPAPDTAADAEPRPEGVGEDEMRRGDAA
jgi:CBS domain containing-hemolysin-like protein